MYNTVSTYNPPTDNVIVASIYLGLCMCPLLALFLNKSFTKIAE